MITRSFSFQVRKDSSTEVFEYLKKLSNIHEVYTIDTGNIFYIVAVKCLPLNPVCITNKFNVNISTFPDFKYLSIFDRVAIRIIKYCSNS